ncbi:MAG: PaaI family thioesterase [Marmoricola sp.]
MLDGGEPPAGALRTMGYRFRSLHPQTGEAEVDFDAPESFGNLMGNVQGGFVAAMLDAAASSALMATLGPDELAPTLELNVSYLRPVPVGRLVGRGRVVHRGGTIGFLAGELYDEDGQVLATATATVRIIRPRT